MVGQAALGVQGPVDGVDDHPHEGIAVVDEPPLLADRGEPHPVGVQRVELGEDDVLGLLVDDQRAVAALAPRPGLQHPLGARGRAGEDLAQAPDRRAAGPEPVGLQRGGDGRHRRHTRRVPPAPAPTQDRPGEPERTAPGPLTAAQARAVTHPGGPLLALGSAGTGKTTVLVARFAWLVEQGAAPESLLALSPSGSAAGALRRRLEDALVRPYEELAVHTPPGICARLLRDEAAEAGLDPFFVPATPADRLALLLDRMDDLELRRHDLAGRPAVLLAGVLERIDRLKADLVTAADCAQRARALPRGDAAQRARAAREAEFAGLYADHDRLLAEQGALDSGELVLRAIALLRERPAARRVARRHRHVLVDDLDGLSRAQALLVELLAGGDGGEGAPVSVTVTAGGGGAAAGEASVAAFRRARPDTEVVALERSLRCPERVLAAARAVLDPGDGHEEERPREQPGGTVRFWRAADERAQAQAVAAEIERLVRGGTAPERIAVLVPSVREEGRDVALALEERALDFRVVGAADFFAQTEVRDMLAWLRLLADPADAGAVVRALARPPVELRSVDLARCVQIARRRKLDMVSALVAATESPQLPPEARERIHAFLAIYRAAAASLDTTRPDLFVHRLIERLGLRRQQVFTAQADVVERLVGLARLGELAGAYARRAPHATPREFARYATAVADAGLPEEDGAQARPGAVQVLALSEAPGREVDWA
ncbi:MAG: ATP-dependent helicase, partial [Actinobacteria bacterium]|nr:ATP-dependent helicase [Actinomycetota bacterium]